MTLRIAIACSGLGSTLRGYERWTQDLALALEPHANVHVLCAKLPERLQGAAIPRLPRREAAALGLPWYMAYVLEELTFLPGALDALITLKPDLIHVSDVELGVLLHGLRRFLPGSPPVILCNGASLPAGLYKLFGHVQVPGPWCLDEVKTSGADPSRVSVVGLGIHAKAFQLRLSARKAREQLGLPSGLLAISVAALSRPKGIDYLIRELAHKKARGWTLLCLGQPTQETPELEKLARKLAPGRVFFRTAPPEAVPEYLRAADLFVMASHAEAYGLALLEAMASGLPALVRDLPSLRSLVNDEAQIDPLDRAGALAARLAEARAPQVRERLGARNRKRARAFDWERLVPAYLAMYEKVLATSSH